jgi:hypothetical protein
MTFENNVITMILTSKKATAREGRLAIGSVIPHEASHFSSTTSGPKLRLKNSEFAEFRIKNEYW